ncbi:3-oxoacyl-[acyl-carrier-protein] reductase [Micromonospora saelicesensis]|uniref:SDR family oxidoreductase n=1 Tax=Micromonospora saelicesensis TaxID=285676 RepID=UPI000DBF7567|nr:SDR family oxidoreductase [Micromonospora saelicesensis]RAO44291.1 3-oxoacyl-[acyl-carrier-protein] reductase [Micromonospora saelicesensis]RAO57338.1 3-oxoacyl-[acyl-carrier-protein] reductase [Micromonospora saelicesensis]RAO63594.1 3-oxoacyl-[acyl-carrier-protein] reductase [Micromonospora saelicesensis]
MGQLDGKTALVTGGTTGIGLAAARRFAAEGAYVFVTGRRKGPVDEAVASIGANVTGIASDVSKLDDLDRVMRAIEERGAGLDVVFANAGGGEFRSLDSITVEHVATTFETNIYGTIFTVQKALPLLNEGASIVLTGSTAASNGTPAFSVYAASKAAIRSFGRTWAAELIGRKIRVNTLIPGSTETPGLAGLAPSPAEAPGLLKAIASGVPMQRMAHPDEIANAALFLASDQSSFMTGGELFVDGGEQQL